MLQSVLTASPDPCPASRWEGSCLPQIPEVSRPVFVSQLIPTFFPLFSFFFLWKLQFDINITTGDIELLPEVAPTCFNGGEGCPGLGVSL